MSEKVRDEFEVECSKLGWYLTRQASANSEYYNHTVVNLCWTFWQASRAALVVELPELKSFNASDEPDFAYEVAIDDIKCALDDAGVGYK